MANPLHPVKTFLDVWEQEKVTRCKIRGVGRVRQSFNILIREILLHELALVSRCVIVKEFDTRHASAQWDSLVKMVDLSKHRLFVVLPSDALLSSPLHVVFAARLCLS